MRLENKNIVIIGAGGLLGSKVVESLLKSGAKIIATDIDTDNLVSRLEKMDVGLNDSNLSIQHLDINNEKNVKEFFYLLDDIDGVVSCAYPKNKTYGAHFYDVTLASFNENVALNLGSTFLVSQQCAAYFSKYNTPFSLVNISSIYGVVAPKFDIYDNTTLTMPVEYAAIKSALQHLNKYVVAYVKNSNFRINSISPGGLLDSQPDNFQQAYKAQTLGQGMLEAKDMMGAITFLLSDSSQYINCQNIIIDDGFTI
ncbi:oxidoreductase [Colwellia sp. TT2012]|uniref:oxidoreductase n=1 Tax=Colwellia sp. TT2012 TaxID=1720342 RepID=UPI00071093B5|nr:oxidoreductase [Colwellia sp. TT2012]